MKKIILLSCLAINLLTSCESNTNSNKKEITVTTINKTQRTYKLKKFNSSCCIGIVKYSLDEVNGFMMMQPNIKNSEITVWFDENKTSEETIISAINTTPYKVI